MNVQRLQDAARMMGISYPTLKQWIYTEKIRSIKTAGGHHRIPQSEIDRILGKMASTGSDRRRPARSEFRTNSKCSKLSGRVVEYREIGSLTKVTIDVGSGQQMISIISRSSARRLNLRRGLGICVLIKATEVTVLRS